MTTGQITQQVHRDRKNNGYYSIEDKDFNGLFILQLDNYKTRYNKMKLHDIELIIMMMIIMKMMIMNWDSLVNKS